MSGKYGVASVKNLMSLGKLAAVSTLQAIAKDGFQAADLLAPLSSETFQSAAAHAIDDFASVLPELNEMDMWDGIEIGKHAFACWNDIKTELAIAIAKIKAKELMAA